MEATSPFGRFDRYYLDEKSMLLVRLEKDEKTQQGLLTTTEKYEDYVVVGGVKFPSTTRISNSIYSLSINSTYTVNPPVSDALFAPPSK